jgi:hypothetical protein
MRLVVLGNANVHWIETRLIREWNLKANLADALLHFQ